MYLVLRLLATRLEELGPITQHNNSILLCVCTNYHGYIYRIYRIYFMYKQVNPGEPLSPALYAQMDIVAWQGPRYFNVFHFSAITSAQSLLRLSLQSTTTVSAHHRQLFAPVQRTFVRTFVTRTKVGWGSTDAKNEWYKSSILILQLLWSYVHG